MKPTQQQLTQILELHQKWLNKDPNGVRADLSGAYLSGADLSNANLSGANLRDADLRGANLRGAYLSGADLSYAYLRDADLSYAYLYGADLSYAYLNSAYLNGDDLSGTDLSSANWEFIWIHKNNQHKKLFKTEYLALKNLELIKIWQTNG